MCRSRLLRFRRSLTVNTAHSISDKIQQRAKRFSEGRSELSSYHYVQDKVQRRSEKHEHESDQIQDVKLVEHHACLHAVVVATKNHNTFFSYFSTDKKNDLSIS